MSRPNENNTKMISTIHSIKMEEADFINAIFTGAYYKLVTSS